MFVFLGSTQTHVGRWECVRYSVCSQSLRGVTPFPPYTHTPKLTHTHTHTMSLARNKAAIVNSPNFTAACRNPVFLFSFSSTSTLCQDQSGLSRQQKPEALASSSFRASLTLPGSLPFTRLRRAICFHLSNSKYPSQKKGKTLAQQKLSDKHCLLNSARPSDYLPIGNLHNLQFIIDCYVIPYLTDNTCFFHRIHQVSLSNLQQQIISLLKVRLLQFEFIIFIHWLHIVLTLYFVLYFLGIKPHCVHSQFPHAFYLLGLYQQYVDSLAIRITYSNMC